ncbi:hypothetical protein CAC42_351 [Sphaceloma murrayae]|uniref:O-acyltransferase n=1 Tax=Sphaceloma murrayae TaxID=2082308 RepID=A0A2K1QZZ6_9PEZI|nr:hypothetical protein CAC42_351 [Sphaceloma murrayae]
MDGKSDDDMEDYDRISLDPDTLVHSQNSKYPDAGSSSDHHFLRIMSGDDGRIRRGSEPGNSEGRRKSSNVRLQKTEEQGKYILTAEDPEIQEIIQRSIAREGAAAAGKPRTRLRDLVFTRQFTTFDRQNPLSSESPFHGFFTLFWLAMVLMFLKVAATNWRDYGSILGNNEVLKIMFSRDVVILGLTDLAMLLSTSAGLLLQKLIFRGTLKWYTAGLILQNVWQSFFLGAIIAWTYYREWPWTHTIFMILHTLVYLMKQYSYASYNGHLSTVYRRKEKLQSRLLQLREQTAKSPTQVSRASGSDVLADKTSTATSRDVKSRSRPGMGSRAFTNLSEGDTDIARVAHAMESGQPMDAGQIEAFERIILAEMTELTTELRGKNVSGDNAYPRNLTLRNFADWTCLPTLVYELEYPRHDSINWWYVAEKTAATFGCIVVMMVISQAYIYPPVLRSVRMKEAGMTLQERASELPWLAFDMLFPLLLEQLLSWYVIWECILNVLAELTCFADRGFYGAWWNSVSFEMYAKLWNTPVHNFLLRHVYHSSISTFQLSKTSAMFVTFLLSALVHELVMVCLFKKVRGYLFTLQIMQVPLAMLSKSRLLRGRDLLGNVIFWIGLFIGPSLLTACYLLI